MQCNHRFVHLTLTARLSFKTWLSSSWPDILAFLFLFTFLLVPYFFYETITLYTCLFQHVCEGTSILSVCMRENMTWTASSEVLWFVSGWWWVDTSSPPALNPPDLTDFPPYFLISCFIWKAAVPDMIFIIAKLLWPTFCNVAFAD